VGKDYSGGMEIIWIFLKKVRFGLYLEDSKVKCNQIRTIDKKSKINKRGQATFLKEINNY
jgi:mRNA-degrading endonuclease toxin of MazEF toxin-antitoxin module